MTENVPVLFVAWRSPKTRLIHPVGRLIHRDDLGLYEFCYIRRVHNAVPQGFVPFIEFPRLGDVYLSDRLFPLFANRVLPNSRPEYGDYAEALGLSPQTANPMTILARTGGRRETDHTEIFPLPLPDLQTGMYVTHCLLRGIRHMPQPTVEDRIARLEPGDRLDVVPDLKNPVDPLAMGVWTADPMMIGYLPAYLARDAGHLHDRCSLFDVHVVRVNPPPSGVHERVLLKVTACWPEGFMPFSTPDFCPVPAKATDLEFWIGPEVAAC